MTKMLSLRNDDDDDDNDDDIVKLNFHGCGVYTENIIV